MLSVAAADDDFLYGSSPGIDTDHGLTNVPQTQPAHGNAAARVWASTYQDHDQVFHRQKKSWPGAEGVPEEPQTLVDMDWEMLDEEGSASAKRSKKSNTFPRVQGRDSIQSQKLVPYKSQKVCRIL